MLLSLLKTETNWGQTPYVAISNISGFKTLNGALMLVAVDVHWEVILI